MRSLNGKIINVIRLIKIEHGENVFSEIDKIQTFLAKYAPEFTRERQHLLQVLECDGYRRLNTAGNDYEWVRAILINKMHDKFGTDKLAAGWAVDIWAMACGKADEKTVRLISQRLVHAVKTGVASNKVATPEPSKPAEPQKSPEPSEAGIGKDNRKCPCCGKIILIKAKICKYCKKVVEMFECPYCAEEILKTSMVCEHCGKSLTTMAMHVIADRWEIQKIKADEVVIDRKTGLMWQRSKRKEMTWDEAIEYGRLLHLGGFSDWRLPTINELKTLIVGCDPNKGGEFLEGPGENGFYWQKGVWYYNANEYGWFWSSSEQPGTGYGWGVRFDRGDLSGRYKSHKYDARYVRDDGIEVKQGPIKQKLQVVGKKDN